MNVRGEERGTADCRHSPTGALDRKSAKRYSKQGMHVKCIHLGMHVVYQVTKGLRDSTHE